MPLPEDPAAYTISLVEGLRSGTGGERVAAIRRDLQQTMDLNAQVYRTEATLKQALTDIQELRRRYRHIAVQDKGARYNTDLLEAIELGFLLDIAGDLPATLPAIAGATLVAEDDHTLDLEMPREMDLNRVFAALAAAGIRVRSMRTKSNRLEELFVRLTGQPEPTAAKEARA